MRGACSLQIIKKIILLVQWSVWNFLKLFADYIGKNIYQEQPQIIIKISNRPIKISFILIEGYLS